MSNIQSIAIFGASGMTGICVLKEALSSGFKKIKLLLREPSRLPSEFHNQVEIIQGDGTNLEDVDKTVESVDAVIVVLGTRNNLGPVTELSRSLQNIVTAMKKYKVSIISVCLSSFLFYEPEKVPPIFKHINSEHSRMFEILKSSGLEYIAVFPPHINDNPKAEYVVKNDASPGGRIVSKFELADFLIKCLYKKEYFGHAVGICSKISLSAS